jgi:hypothetical protein
MNKLAFILSVALLVPLSSAFAESSIGVSLQGNAGLGQAGGAQADIKAETSVNPVRIDDGPYIVGTASGDVRTHASSSDGSASSTEHGGDDMSVAHRSTVAAFVQSLLRAADRDGGIGAKVRAVAESQNASASTTADAILHVEGRNAFLSFLIGTDWKNVGTLRNEIAKTGADIANLKVAISQASDASVKADLQAQLTALQAEQAKVQAFVDAHEKSFSLFGWFTKIFASGSVTATTTANTTAQ